MKTSPLAPSVMLATSIHAQPGVYALLLGSGVSTGAEVPTGWGVVRELVRRAAAALHPQDPTSLQLATADPEEWWRQHGQGVLGYSSLLEAIAPTASARQGLLADFFEPRDEERQEGVKIPSKAHHAVARLVKRGFIKVILTTNFDRLIEQALEAQGVAPQVIARPEAINGMAPLAHSPATVVKLHGDYKDLGSRNTLEELGTYPDEWNRLLRQVFDEYGLIICGWSGEWDGALVSALDSTTSRRYPLYWDSRSSKGEAAHRLLDRRLGNVLPAAGADEMFGDLVESLDALERLAQPPLTTAMAVARLKKYLPDPLRRIDLHDLVMHSAQVVADTVTQQRLHQPSLDGGFVQELWESYLQASAPLVQLLVTGIWHDSETHDGLWVEVLQRLVDSGTAPLQSATGGLDDARLWPAVIAMTAMGVTAVRRRRDSLLILLGEEVRGRASMGTSEPLPAAQLLHPNRLFQDNWVNSMPRWNTTRWLYPASHLLKTDTRTFFEDLIPLESDYRDAFHGYEYRLGLIQGRQSDSSPMGYQALSGEYVGQNGWTRGESEMPHAEVDFRRVTDLTPASPWSRYLGEDDLEGWLSRHREALKRYRRFG